MIAISCKCKSFTLGTAPAAMQRLSYAILVPSSNMRLCFSTSTPTAAAWSTCRLLYGNVLRSLSTTASDQITCEQFASLMSNLSSGVHRPWRRTLKLLHSLCMLHDVVDPLQLNLLISRRLPLTDTHPAATKSTLMVLLAETNKTGSSAHNLQSSSAQQTPAMPPPTTTNLRR